jgi:type IV pilus assembly protein PilO
MEISISKLPWWGQIGLFVLMAGASVYGFYTYYVSDVNAELNLKKTHLASLKQDVTKGMATARNLKTFENEVTDLEHKLENLKNVLPEQKDVADILRRIQGLATQSNLTLVRFQPVPPKQQPLYLEVPYHLVATGNYHNLGLFLDRVSKFPRIINVSEISMSARPQQTPNDTVTIDCVATTFVLSEAPASRGGRGAPPVR